MELDNAQSIVNPEGDLRGFLVRCQLDYGCGFDRMLTHFLNAGLL